MAKRVRQGKKGMKASKGATQSESSHSTLRGELQRAMKSRLVFGMMQIKKS